MLELNSIELGDNKMGRYKKDMSYEERRAYRKRRRLLRRIQVYSEICLIVIVLALVGGLIVSKIKGTDKSLAVAADEKTEESTGLKVSSKGTESEEVTEEVTEEEEEDTSLKYFASETNSTVTISGDIVSPYGILINNDTKEIVASLNSNEKIVPASMTKVMTVLVAAENISEDQLNEVVSLSHEAVDYSYAGGGSTSGFVEGEEVTVRDLFYGTILPSGGDAAAQLAIYVAGDIDTFVGMMNDKAAEMELTGTNFTNPVGFYDDNHYSTPYEIAMIMMAALDNEICNEVINTKVYNSTSTNINPEGITISNWFLRRIEDKDIGGTIGGAKTGYVNESGSCAVSSMISDSGTEYICCTVGSSSSWQCIYDHVYIYQTYAE